MKNTFLLFAATLILMLSLNSCSKVDMGKVKVHFTNKSAYDLTEIKVQNKSIGNLRSAEVSPCIHFEHFSFDSGFPAEDIEVTKDGLKIIQKYPGFCGTEYHTMVDGSYDVQIDVYLNIYGVPITQMR